MFSNREIFGFWISPGLSATDKHNIFLLKQISTPQYFSNKPAAAQ
jgi:hypothetical protein